MDKSRGVMNDLKNWITKQISVEQPKSHSKRFIEQLINLEPIFNSKTLFFEGVICNDLYKPTSEVVYLKGFKDALENIAYWCCHGRAILTLIPLPITFLNNENLMKGFEKILIESQLPVGLIRLMLIGSKDFEHKRYEQQLAQLQRLGLILELHHFSGSKNEFNNMKTGLFQGVHLSTNLIRAAMKTSYSFELFNDLLIICNDNNYHVYGEGISLVHDFNFVKENKVQFCYGPLLMPAVSKHQLLKITMSHFNDFIKNTPKKKIQNGN